MEEDRFGGNSEGDWGASRENTIGVRGQQMEGAYVSPDWLSHTRLWLLTTVSVNVVAWLSLLLPRLIEMARATAQVGLSKIQSFYVSPAGAVYQLFVLLLTHRNAPCVCALGKLFRSLNYSSFGLRTTSSQ